MCIIEFVRKYLSDHTGIIIAIDGPSGVGKSTLAALVAERLNITYFSMGGMFRSLALIFHNQGIDIDNELAVTSYIESSSFRVEKNVIYINNITYSKEILKSMSKEASFIAANSIYHSLVSKKVRKIFISQNIVVEGRAMGSHVFTNANIKIFLDASMNTRVNRRLLELANENVVLNVKEQIIERDKRDRERVYAPLVCNDDYFRISTTSSSIEEVFSNMVNYIYCILVLGNMNNEKEIIKKIKSILYGVSYEKETYEIEQLYWLLNNLILSLEYHQVIELDNKIPLSILNSIGNRTYKNKKEQLLWGKVFQIIPKIELQAKEYGISTILNITSYEEVKRKASSILEIINQTVYDKSQYYQTVQFDSVGYKDSLVALIKPPFSSDTETIAEIIKRIVCHNCTISAMRVFDGEYFQTNYGKIAEFYHEAYEGYCNKPVDKSLVSGIRKMYNVPLFSFLFEERFSEEMIFPAEKLIKEFGVSPDVISELWDYGRHELSIEELKEYLKLSEVIIHHGKLKLCKNDSEISIPDKIYVNDKVMWYHNSLCFGINKVSRSRSAFCVKDSRIRNGKTTIIVNGHFQGLLDMFTRPTNVLTIALLISTNNQSSKLDMLRKCLSGDNSSPGKCLPSSIRKDAYDGVLSVEWDARDRSVLNGLHNVIHLSNGPLEGLAEICNFFEKDYNEIPFGQLLNEQEVDKYQIQYLMRNPYCVKACEGFFELTANKEDVDALTIIKHHLS